MLKKVIFSAFLLVSLVVGKLHAQTCDPFHGPFNEDFADAILVTKSPQSIPGVQCEYFPDTLGRYNAYSIDESFIPTSGPWEKIGKHTYLCTATKASECVFEPAKKYL